MKKIFAVLLTVILIIIPIYVFAEDNEMNDEIIPLVGAIRWDAYFSTEKSDSGSIANQVSRTLSYYPAQAPYYAIKRENSDGDITLAFDNMYEKNGLTYTLDDVSNNELKPKEIKYTYGISWEEEAEMAYDAGIRFFAYVFYNNGDAMSLPRKAHTAKNGMLESGNQIKMSIILEHSRLGKVKPLDKTSDEDSVFKSISFERRQIYQAMAQSCYLCLPGEQRIPVFYCMHANQYNASELTIIKDEALFVTSYLEKHKPEKYKHIDDVYFVGMQSEVMSQTSIMKYSSVGFDALSRYSSWTNFSDGDAEELTRYEYDDYSLKNGQNMTVISRPYKDLIDCDVKYNDSYKDSLGNMEFIPAVSLGLSFVPRIKTGVSWTGDYGKKYYRVGTPEEQAENIRRTKKYLTDNDSMNSLNAMLIYAWNEHDEGGYLCPHIKVDEKGIPMLNEDGTFQKDTSTLDAVKKALYEKELTQKNNSENCNSDMTENGKNKKKGSASKKIIAIITSTAALVGITVSSSLIISKKNKKSANKEK